MNRQLRLYLDSAQNYLYVTTLTPMLSTLIIFLFRPEEERVTLTRARRESKAMRMGLLERGCRASTQIYLHWMSVPFTFGAGPGITGSIEFVDSSGFTLQIGKTGRFRGLVFHSVRMTEEGT